MALKQISLVVPVDYPPDEAQDNILRAVDPRLRALGYAPQSDTGTVAYRLKVYWPAFVWAVRALRGERVTFTFESRGAGTHVRVDGRLRDDAYTEVTEALGPAGQPEGGQ